MAMHSKRLTKEHNLCFHYDDVKTNGSTVQRNKGGLRGKKALNDTSNSKNVIPIGEDLGVSKKAQIPVVVGKAQISGKKTQVSGRKASGDLTNSVKQQGLKRKGLEKKSIAIATVQRNKGGLRGRKALNDTSNSKNAIPIKEDLGVSKKAQIPVVVGKAQISGKETQVSGRKASGDLTNSVKQQGLKKKGLQKKSIAIAEDEYENLHDHEKCIESQKYLYSMNLHELLLGVTGLGEDVSWQPVYTSPRKSMDEDLPFRQ